MRNGKAEKGLGPSGQEKQVNETLLKKIVLAQKKNKQTQKHITELKDLQQKKKSANKCDNIQFPSQFYADILC